MKSYALILVLPLALTASASMASAQTAPKPSAKPATAAHAATAHSAAVAAAPVLPAGIPPVKAPIKPLAVLRYQEITVGTGSPALPNKVYKVIYTGWLAADGHKFDASADHPAQPIFDHNFQPEKGPDGKPILKAGQPYMFPQGFGRAIPGFDNGFEGMKIGGKRRLFIPYQLAYGVVGRPTGDPKNPGIPAKADLIFDIELVDVLDMPQQPAPAAHSVAAAPQPEKPEKPTQPASTAPATSTTPTVKPETK